jgi:hypothetical protein
MRSHGGWRDIVSSTRRILRNPVSNTRSIRVGVAQELRLRPPDAQHVRGFELDREIANLYLGIRVQPRAAGQAARAVMTFWAINWLRAFGVTLAAEAPIVVWLTRGVEPMVVRRIGALVIANLATHPLVWFLFPALRLSYPIRSTLSEIMAVVVEAGAYLVVWPRLGTRRAFVMSFAANAASVLLGLALRGLD